MTKNELDAQLTSISELISDFQAADEYSEICEFYNSDYYNSMDRANVKRVLETAFEKIENTLGDLKSDYDYNLERDWETG